MALALSMAPEAAVEDPLAALRRMQAAKWEQESREASAAGAEAAGAEAEPLTVLSYNTWF